MKIQKLFLWTIVALTLLFFQSCNQKGSTADNSIGALPFDSLSIAPFFKSYPELKKYEKELVVIYQNYDFNYVWFDQKDIVVYGNTLYNKVINIEEEGVFATFPYQENIDDIFEGNIKDIQKDLDRELLLTSLYLFYVDEVYKGLDHSTTTLLPRKKVSYTVLLDSFISGEKLQPGDSLKLFNQYYKLRHVLKKYKDIKENGGGSRLN